MPAFDENSNMEKLQYTMKTIEENEGKTLVLFKSKEELQWFREHSTQEFPSIIILKGMQKLVS